MGSMMGSIPPGSRIERRTVGRWVAPLPLHAGYFEVAREGSRTEEKESRRGGLLWIGSHAEGTARASLFSFPPSLGIAT